jgi:YNFM family putative membrane transporter
LTQTVPKNKRSVLLSGCIINLLAVSTVFMTQSIFLELSQTFRTDITEARFSFSVVSLFYCVSFFFLGPAADKFNLPRMALTGMLLLAITVFYSSLTSDFSLFIIAMACMGISAAIVPASMFPYIAKTAPANKIGVYMGSIVASGTLGVILGRVSMGIMTALVGWQVSFRIVSAALVILAAATFPYLAKGNDGTVKNTQKLSRLYLNSLQLLSNAKILSFFLIGFCLFIGFLGMVTFLTYRLIGPPFNFTSGEIGWISFAGITALIAPYAGYLSQKFGQYRTIFISLVVCLLSFQLMGWFQSVTLTAIGILLLFLGVYTCQPLVFVLIGRSAPREAIGSASALYILFCVGGGSLSSIFLGPVWRSFGWSGVTAICTISLMISLLILTMHTCRERRAAHPETGKAPGLNSGTTDRGGSNY